MYLFYLVRLAKKKKEKEIVLYKTKKELLCFVSNYKKVNKVAIKNEGYVFLLSHNRDTTDTTKKCASGVRAAKWNRLREFPAEILFERVKKFQHFHSEKVFIFSSRLNFGKDGWEKLRVKWLACKN